MKAIAQRPKQSVGRIVSFPGREIATVSLAECIGATGKLVLPVVNGFHCIPYQQIRFLKAEGNYTAVHTPDRKYLFAKTLKSVESRLPASLFFRVHKSFLVNATWIKSYVCSGEEAYLLLEDETQVPVSRAARARMQ